MLEWDHVVWCIAGQGHFNQFALSLLVFIRILWLVNLMLAVADHLFYL